MLRIFILLLFLLPFMVKCQNEIKVEQLTPTKSRLTLANGATYDFDSIVPLTRSTCNFVGIHATNKDDWLDFSNCKFIKEGRYMIGNDMKNFEFIGDSSTRATLVSTDPNPGPNPIDPEADPAPSKVTALQKRLWNYESGKFVFELDIELDEISANQPIGPKKRRKRQALPNFYELELGIFVDQGLWDLYVQRYTAAEAKNALDEYIQTVINTAELLWRIDSIAPKIRINLIKYEVWQTQPTEVAGASQGDMETYLDAACKYLKPQSDGYDHVAFISGYDLRRNNARIGGLAYTGRVCTDLSCSVINGEPVSGFRAGYTLAHEIGHALNMKHDGDSRFPDTASCDPQCCIMTALGAGTTLARWSTCSQTRYQAKVRELGADNCLDAASTADPINNMPGQAQPDEAQCISLMGACARFYPIERSNCRRLLCTNTNGVAIAAYAFMRLDGTYCGPTKVCKGGQCVTTNTALTPTNGVWSVWNTAPETKCGGSGCSACAMQQQQPMSVNVRSCNNPYPNNGGSPCIGGTVRGNICSNQAVCTGSSARDKTTYMTVRCALELAKSIASVRTECTFVCFTAQTEFTGRLFLPNGSPCSTNGRCVQGQCMFASCTDKSIYVANVNDCPSTAVPCVMSTWTQWTTCSTTCGTGSRQRSRTVTQQPSNGGAACGSLSETESCFITPCVTLVDCQYSDWGQWGACSVSCGTGTRTRSRTITQQPQNGGIACSTAALTGTGACSTTCPPVNCQWGTWGSWGACSQTCGTGQRSRTRTITTQGSSGGAACNQADGVNTGTCQVVVCPVVTDCVWGTWGLWSNCSSSCGTGLRTRSRTVQSEATNGGKACNSLDSSGVATCQGAQCARDCSYTQWSAWGVCSVTCGPGQKNRIREVFQEAQNGGVACQTSLLTGTESCEVIPCPQNCVYSTWSVYSTCSATCGQGTHTKTRSIVTQASNGGIACNNNQLSQTDSCDSGVTCPDCTYGQWTAYGSCSVTCGQGVKVRTRTAQAQGGATCDFVRQTETCILTGCAVNCGYSQWTQWNPCTTTCGPGTQFRSRQITQQPQNGGTPCNANALSDSKTCNLRNCLNPKDCGYSQWTQWTECSAPCGPGSQQRSRQITQQPQDGGTPCNANALSDSKTCNLRDCCTQWTQWSQCSETCGPGTQQRNRQLSQTGGILCDSNAFSDSKPCNVGTCNQIDCGYSQWSQWSICTVTCGTGSHQRSRVIVRQPQHGGQQCDSNALLAVEPCDAGSCTCGYSQWSQWGQCSQTCGPGQATRTRAIITNHQSCNANDLIGTKSCIIVQCQNPVHCQWSSWSVWDTCSATCGGGSQTRTRQIVQEGLNGGTPCNDNDGAQSQQCNTHACTSDGDFHLIVRQINSAQPVGPGKKSVNAATRIECEAQCNEGCNAYVWSDQAQACYLYSSLYNQIMMLNISVYHLYARNIGSSVHYACNYILTRSNLNVLGNLHLASLGGTTADPDNCQMNCMVRKKDKCQGFTWDSRLHLCYFFMQKVSEWDSNRRGTTTYYELRCRDISKGGWITPTPGPTGLTPIDCRYTEWSSWGGCSATCGTGLKRRQRTISQQPINGGQHCSSSAQTQEVTCLTGVQCGGQGTFTATWLHINVAFPVSKQHTNLSQYSDCALACQQYAGFACKAYATAGIGSECYLYGTINQPIIITNSSSYSLYEIVVGGVNPAHEVCAHIRTHTNVIHGENDPIGLLENRRQGGFVLGPAGCQTLCVNRFLSVADFQCEAFVINIKSKMCYLYSEIDKNKITHDMGTQNEVYQMICKFTNKLDMADFADFDGAVLA